MFTEDKLGYKVTFVTENIEEFSFREKIPPLMDDDYV